MANIRQRMVSVERMLGKVQRGSVLPHKVEEILDWADSELDVVKRTLEEGGDSNAPICCFTVQNGQIGCGRYVDPAHEEFVMDIMAPLEEFVKYCKECRRTIGDKLPRTRGEVERARALHKLPLEEILGDLERLHIVQNAIQHLHTPITSNDELERQVERILPYVQSLPYHGGQFEDELKKIYFALGRRDSSAYQGGGWIRIAQSLRGQSSIYTELAHELAHLLVGVLGANEATAMILGLETSAVMTLDGDKNHEISLYRTVKNLIAYTAYVKIRRAGWVPEWREIMGRLFPSDLVDQTEKDYQGCFAEEFEGEVFSFQTPLSHYMLVPYLSLKETLRESRNYIPQGDIYEEDIEIPALVEILGRVWA